MKEYQKYCFWSHRTGNRILYSTWYTIILHVVFRKFATALVTVRRICNWFYETVKSFVNFDGLAGLSEISVHIFRLLMFRSFDCIVFLGLKYTFAFWRIAFLSLGFYNAANECDKKREI